MLKPVHRLSLMQNFCDNYFKKQKKLFVAADQNYLLRHLLPVTVVFFMSSSKNRNCLSICSRLHCSVLCFCFVYKILALIVNKRTCGFHSFVSKRSNHSSHELQQSKLFSMHNELKLN